MNNILNGSIIASYDSTGSYRQLGLQKIAETDENSKKKNTPSSACLVLSKKVSSTSQIQESVQEEVETFNKEILQSEIEGNGMSQTLMSLGKGKSE